MNDYNLLKKLCEINATSGSEHKLTSFLINHIKKNQKNWKQVPKIYHGENFQNNIVLSFGEPKTAIFAHIDSIGYTVSYNNNVVKIGGSKLENDISLVGEDSQGNIETILKIEKERAFVKYSRIIDRGTPLSYKVDFKLNNEYVQSAYLDNRLGVYSALKVAESLTNGVIVFSTWEEHGGGSVSYLSKFIFEKLGINKALISDITWITKGIKHNKGVVISLRDSAIPRKIFLDSVIEIANKHKIKYQLEVESSGGSDGNEIQKSPYPIDWCFIGAAEDNVHTPIEKVHLNDIESMIEFYKILMREL